MEQSHQSYSGKYPGGIISLGRFVEEHREAIQADLITSASVELDDVGSTLSWGAFSSFVKNLGYDSALWRSVHPEVEDWGTVLRTNIILSDIYDILASINTNICAGFSHKKKSKPKPYPRPWLKAKERRLGKGALPKEELREWIKNYRRKNK